MTERTKREENGADRMGRRNLLGRPAGSLNTVTPCAACKLLRRRCAQNCPFSPYFSPEDTQKFASVHKVFGASNVSKMLMEVPESQRAAAANSLVYESNVRLSDPIYGCLGPILALNRQIHTLEAELSAVRAEILKHKFRQTYAAAAANVLPTSHVAPITPFGTGVTLTVAWPPPPPPPILISQTPVMPTTHTSPANDKFPYFG